MADRNWGMIRSGATFEGLVSCLIYFEDQKAALFGRRGKDGGQDVRSGDGLTVYQAKYHENKSAARAMKDAEREAAKIAEYLSPDHPRHAQWQHVRQWVLVTNAEFNPTDDHRWKEQIAPRFQKIGLRARYWGRADLDTRLHGQREVDRSYFLNEKRVLLSLPEAQERFELDAVFLSRATRVTLRGRQQELASFKEFLSSSATFLVVDGPGGVGKTRFLLEAASEIAAPEGWQVFWANTASMEAGPWYDAIVPERPTLLLVDEPQDEKLLRLLVEQVGGGIGRTSQWKVAIAVRSSNDLVLRFLRGSRMTQRSRELPLNPIRNDMELLCADLLEGGPLAGRPEAWKAEASRRLAKLCDGYPVWASLAVEILEKHSDLAAMPEKADSLADEYVRQISGSLAGVPREDVHSLLRWVALVGPLNREDGQALKNLEEFTRMRERTKLLGSLKRLVEQGVLVQRGARDRFVELRPDVLRDHILRGWLVSNAGFGEEPFQPTDDARTIVNRFLETVKMGAVEPLDRTVLRSFARTEWLFRAAGCEVSLLTPLFGGLEETLANWSAASRVLLIQVITEIASVYPREITTLSTNLRSSRCEEQTISGLFGERTVGPDEVILELGWMVFHAAMGARGPEDRQAVLAELCALVEAEEDIAGRRPGGLLNDGKRAAQLVGRILEGGPDFLSSFDDEACAIGIGFLERLKETEFLSVGRAKVLHALLEPAIAMERRQTFFERSRIIGQSFLIQPGQPAWQGRAELLDLMRSLLTQGSLIPNVAAEIWKILSSGNRNMVLALNTVQDGASRDLLRSELKGDLRCAIQSLSTRSATIQELRAARDLWDWHLRFDRDPESRGMAEVLERLYTSNELSAEFTAFTSYGSADRDRKDREKAQELAASGDPSKISNWVDRAVEYLGEAHDIRRFSNMGRYLGELAPTSECVRGFVRASVRQTNAFARFTFACFVTKGWLAALRKAGDGAEATEIATEVVNLIPDSSTRAALLQEIYERHVPAITGPVSADEHNFLRSNAKIFLEADRGVEFLLTFGWSFSFDWEGYKRTAERVLEARQSEEIAVGVNALVAAAHWGYEWVAEKAHLPIGLGQWLLDQVLQVPDLDTIDDTSHYCIKDILRATSRPPLQWLVGALQRRIEMEKGATEETTFYAASGHRRLSSYVQPIGADTLLNTDVRQSINELVLLAADCGLVGRYVPEHVRDVDPQGLMVPDLVVVNLHKLGSECIDEVLRLARLGGVYLTNSLSWRKVAIVVCRIAASVDEKTRRSLFESLIDRRARPWAGTRGEVPKLFPDAVDEARRFRDEETDPIMVPFWDWYLKTAEANLKAHTEWAKEEREE